MYKKQVIVRTGLVSFVAANLLLAASLPSKAQIRLEMNQVTCGEFLGYSPESQDFVRYWMSGYYSAAANRNVLDYKRLQKNSTKVTAYCKKHKSDTLPTAIKKVAS
jgi:acid stress chaperone HdeB